MQIERYASATFMCLIIGLLAASACIPNNCEQDADCVVTDESSEASGDGDLPPGDGDPSDGDGDGDPTSGDGDGDPSDGDGDGDPTSGDGDGEPSVCGDGIVQDGEECDAGPANGPGNECTSHCTLNVCGDGEVGPGEGCDDGNAEDEDGCTNACVLVTCGDGVVGPGEACDDGNQVETDECTTICTVSPETPVLQLSYSAIKQFQFTWAPVLGAEFYRILESKNVGDNFVDITGNVVSQSVTRTMPLHLRVNASYKLVACNANGCSESVPVTVVDSLAAAVGYFKASNSGTGDWFGYTVAISGDGNTLAVGASGEGSQAAGIGGNQSDDSAVHAGAVYVFVRSGTSWSQQAYVKASNTGLGDVFGASLALSNDGNTLAVGAFLEDSGATGIGGNQADNSMSDAGAVYVFVRNGTAWSQQAYVKASNSEAVDYFGYSVALAGDGSTMAVGAYWEDSAATGVGGNQADNSMPGSGAVYMFVRNGDIWSQQAYIKASNPGAFDRFGYAVALSSSNGNTLAVGAIEENSSATGIGGNQADNLADNAGAVYVFVRNGNAWSQQAYVKASNTGAGDYFGWSVTLSSDGNTMAVGASLEDSSAPGIGGNQADNGAAGSGAAYVYVRNGGVWSQQAYVKASNTAAGDRFGYSLALSATGSILAVTAFSEDSQVVGLGGDQTDNSATGAGAAYVFVRSGAVWSQRSYVKASNTGSGDAFGFYAGLSADGNILAVGAKDEKSSATGVGGNQGDNSKSECGAVYLY